MTTQAAITQTIPEFERRQAKYAPVAAALDNLYGWPDWRPSHPPMDELVDCILSQSTNDNNRDRAFAALKARYPDWEAVLRAPEAEVVETIKPAGLANQKGKRIQQVLQRIKAERGALSIDFLADESLEDAKNWLTSLDGVGPKTAAIVLCFAFNRPAFPVDTHVHRVGQRIGFLPTKLSAEKAHPVMEAIVPPEDYYAFHLNVIRLGREICRARRPDCARCPLQAHCDYFQTLPTDKPVTEA
ncbi:MAG: endonuclease III [Chloroflexi bacterium]|nr:endonuclease III [Chloroflexota bacterium]